MAMSGTGGIQFGSDPEFDEYHTLLLNSLPPNFPDSRDELRAEWEILPASQRQGLLQYLRDRSGYLSYPNLWAAGARRTSYAGLGAFSDIANSVFGPNYQRDINVTSNRLPGFAANIRSYSPWSATFLNNPPGHVGVIMAPTDDELTSGLPAIGNSPNRQGAFSHPDYAHHIQFYSLGPVALGHDGFGIIPADIDDGNGVTRMPFEARATGDDETARYTKMLKTLVSVNFTNAFKAGKILKSSCHSTLPLSSKISGFFTVSSASVAVLSSLAGFCLSTLKPNTLPFGCNPQRVMEIIHDVGVYSTAYAFIGTMCHEFLQDDPFIMFTTAALASAAFTGLMTFIGRRRGQGTFRAGGDFAAV